MFIFIDFERFEALEVREPGAAWGNLGRPGAAWGSLGQPGPVRHLPLFKEFTASWILGTSGWMLGHWAPRG